MIFGFDFWNTLYALPGSKESRAAVRTELLIHDCRELGLPRAETIAGCLFDEVEAFTKESWARGLNPTQRAIVEHLQERWEWITVDTWSTLNESIDRIYSTALRPILLSGAPECLAWCHSQGPVYLISDTFTLTGKMLRNIMKVDGIHDKFSALFFSDEVGVKKPNPYSFRQICAREGCAASDVIYVGDDMNTDYRAAEAAGAQFILVAPNASLAGWTGDVAPSLESVLEILKLKQLNWEKVRNNG
jgi:FMN phosphatase YigB (HAD superfamily)